MAPLRRPLISVATALVVLCTFARTDSSFAQSQGAIDKGAQPAPEDSDGKQYVANVVQVDGTRRQIVYYRDKDGSIIPPAIVDGKLVDGSAAPIDPVRARVAQRRILVPYDKNAQIALAMVGDRNLMRESGMYINNFGSKVEAGQDISLDEFKEFLYYSFIYMEAGSKGDGFMKVADLLAKGKFKLADSSYEELKQKARERARRDWKEVTRALD